MSSTVNPELVRKFKNAKKLKSEDGFQVKTEVREDEEQSVKLQEIIDILVAAGYFRARIKGLSSFDKVVGGMVWCIESCNVDLDVDLLFSENLSIGQKISLTEKIVAVLPKLKCPRSIEPHQIQGLDFIHIYPVIQWLVKRSLECRQEVASFVRACAVDQFDKKFAVVDKNHTKHASLLENLNIISEVYRPHRYYKRKISTPVDTHSQLQITLLEYGYNEGNTYDSVSIEKPVIEEQQKIDNLSEEHLDNLNEHYSSLQVQLQDPQICRNGMMLLDSLEEKKQIFTEKCNEYADYISSLDNDIKNNKVIIQELCAKQQEANTALEELNDVEVNESKIKEIEDLIILNDDLKSQETQFKEQCKKELDALHKLIDKTKIAKTKAPNETVIDMTDDIIAKQEKIKNLRIKLAKVNREVALLERQVDDIPKRAELAQYQKRFVELYNQMSVKHKETKQYYTLYNTLDDTRFWMKKELSLLNSISESYPEAMTSPKAKDEFLDQFQNILESVKNSEIKAEQKLEKEKQTRDHLSNTLHSLVELQRKYVAAVKQLGVECRKQEMLIRTQGDY